VTELKSPRDSTIRKLFALSMNQCAFPDCTTTIIDSSTSTILGEICHICAQNPGGPRYDHQQTSEERHSFENVVLLCRNHHKVIDAHENIHIYTVEYLTRLRAVHEENARNLPSDEFTLSEALVSNLKRTLESYSSPNVYMDFQGASFRAGGDGGYLGGDGGDGGVINIVGVTPSGFHEPIDANGRDGQAPGAGGGGGGVVSYTGRPADITDIDNGLKISTIFLADAVRKVQGLLYVLGGGWEWCVIPSLPCNLQLNLVCIVETGNIPVNTMLRIDYSVENPEGHTALVSYSDLSVLRTTSQIRRYHVISLLTLEINCIGIWCIKVSSGKIPLVKHNIEFRLTNDC
jgi:hypothetical protein